MSVHGKFSSSSLHNYEKCARYVKKENDDSDAARMGTLCHKAIEENRPELIADEDLRKHVLTCLKFMQDMRAAYPSAIVTQEQKLTGTYNRGTADLCLVVPDMHLAIITDWKFGMNAVEHPDRNIQLWSYALQLFEQYAEVNEVMLYVLQPKLSDKPLVAKRHRKDNGEIMTRIEKIIAGVEDPTTPPTPDPGTCEWCGAKATCPALQKYAAMALRSGMGLPVPDTYTLGADCTANDIAARQIMASILSDYCDQAKKAHTTWLQEHPGETIPGFRLVDRAGNWKIVDQDRLVELLMGRGVSAEELLSCAKISPKQLAEQAAAGNSMIDAAEYLENLQSEGLVERGAQIRYLVKTFKGNEVEKLKELQS